MPPRQAVVIIHGMGEQRPMDTLRSFVRAVWQSDAGIKEEPDPAGDGERSDIAAIEKMFGVRLGETTFFPDRLDDEEPEGFRPKRAWLAPDSATGSPDLYRMTDQPPSSGPR